MNLKYFHLLFLLLVVNSCSKTSTNKYNLNFEQIGHIKGQSKGWFKGSDYNIIMDTNTDFGNYSAKIVSDNIGKEGRVLYGIPAKYSGESIQLEGYIKTKEVKEGFVGLFLKIENEKGFVLAFENMGEKKVNGTNEWKKYNISIPYPEDAEYIYIGGILSGKGEAWFDNFKVTIDGADIQKLKENDNKVFLAKLDTEFDMDSGIKIPTLNDKIIDNLDLLGKIWGFLKYYHPKITKGNYNWDYELFRILPKYLNSKTSITRNKILLNWIKSYGVLNKCLDCKKTSDKAILKPDFKWMNESDISNELKSLLFNIYNNRNQGEQYYVGLEPYVKNPNFTNENPYREMVYPDKGFRLLALFRYWNIIQYFFPYKHLMDKEWSKVQKEYISKVINAKNELEYELAFLKLIGEVKDTHANLYGANRIENIRGQYLSAYKVEFIEKKLVVTDYHNRTLIKKPKLNIGDVITHINNVPVQIVVDSLKEYYPASNNAAKMRDISEDILRSKKNRLLIKYNSDTIIKEKELKLFKTKELNIVGWSKTDGEKSFKFINDNILYITLKSIKKEDINKIKPLLKKAKGVIIDIRNYPNTFVPYSLGSSFVSKETPFVKLTKMKLNNPGEFNFKKTLKIIPDSEYFYSKKLVVLVNEYSQSQSEFTAMAFRAGVNTTIIGSTTAGADGNVSFLSIPGGLSSRFSGIGIYYPNGEQTQRVGIIPDIIVKPTIKGIKEGKDELLNEALKVINNEY